MGRSFFYGSDARIVEGSANFAAKLVEDPEQYGVPPELAAGFAERNAALQEAFRVASAPATRSPVAVARKTIVLKEVQRAASNLGSIISATSSVTDADLIVLGLLPRRRYGLRTAPMHAEPPTVQVDSVVGRRVTIRIHAWNTAGRRKPEDTCGAHVHTFVGEESPTHPRQYQYHGLATRATYAIQFPNDVPSGGTVWVCASWLSRRGKVGASCQPVRVTIQGGLIVPAA